MCVLLGCTGTLSSAEPGAGRRDGGGGAPDAAVSFDAGPGIDGGAGVDGGPGVDAGPGEVDAGPMGEDAGPCADVSCGANARCVPETGRCVCSEGFVDEGGACVAPAPGDPATRSAMEVCDAWRDGHVENASPVWEGDGTECGPGTLPREAIDDTLRRVNLFRWLAGLPPVTDDPGQHQGMMECAAIMSANGRLSHDPPMDWACWTSAGAGAGGSANIAWGYGSSAAAIDGYMADRNTPSLGHRRWILNEGLGRVGIGFSRVSSRPGQCLGVFGGGGPGSDRTWTAYPNPGPAPRALTQNDWSFHSHGVRMTSETGAIVERVSDGMELPVMTEQTGGFGPPPSVRIVPMGWSAEAGESYRVTITNLSGGEEISYVVDVIDC